MKELYPWLIASIAVATQIFVFAKWFHRREQTTLKVNSLGSRVNMMEQSFIELKDRFAKHELKIAESYIHRDDYIISTTRLERKLDRVLEHLAGINKK